MNRVKFKQLFSYNTTKHSQLTRINGSVSFISESGKDVIHFYTSDTHVYLKVFNLYGGNELKVLWGADLQVADFYLTDKENDV
jgi:hypothetical protein